MKANNRDNLNNMKKLFSFSNEEIKNVMNEYIKAAAKRRSCTESRVIEDALLFQLMYDPGADEKMVDYAKALWKGRYLDPLKAFQNLISEIDLKFNTYKELKEYLEDLPDNVIARIDFETEEGE